MSGNKPEMTVRIGLISASIWTNAIETGKETKEVRSVVFQRRYKDRDSGEWKSSETFGLADLPALKEVISLALTFVAAKEAYGG